MPLLSARGHPGHRTPELLADNFFKGAPHPNAGKLFLDFLLSKEVVNNFIGGEAVHTFREGYTPAEHAKPYLIDLSKTKLLGLNDWLGASKKTKGIRGK